MDTLLKAEDFATELADDVACVALVARQTGIAKFDVAHFPMLGREMSEELARAAVHYLTGYEGSFEFLTDLKRRANSLSDGQIKGVLNCMLAEARRRPQAAAARPVEDGLAAELAADEAYRRFVLSQPVPGFAVPTAIPAGRYVIDVAGTDVTLVVKDARNAPGTQWVAIRANGEDELVGRIAEGAFRTSRTSRRDRVQLGAAALEALVDGGQAAIEAALVGYGRATGACGICGRLLTDPESVARGIGPICAEKIGL